MFTIFGVPISFDPTLANLTPTQIPLLNVYLIVQLVHVFLTVSVRILFPSAEVVALRTRVQVLEEKNRLIEEKIDGVERRMDERLEALKEEMKTKLASVTEEILASLRTEMGEKLAEIADRREKELRKNVMEKVEELEMAYKGKMKEMDRASRRLRRRERLAKKRVVEEAVGRTKARGRP